MKKKIKKRKIDLNLFDIEESKCKKFIIIKGKKERYKEVILKAKFEKLCEVVGKKKEDKKGK